MRSIKIIQMMVFVLAFITLGLSDVHAQSTDTLAPARANRLAINLSFGLGSASLSDLHDSHSVEDLKSNFQINVGVGLRYYFPYYVLADIGYATIYNSASSNGVDQHNLNMEVPILIGGYYTFIDRLYVFGAMGPSILFYGRTFNDPGADFKADTSVGFQIQAGADYMLTNTLSLGLDLRYRAIGMGELSDIDFGTPTNVELDLSGISIVFNLRIYAI